MTLGGPDVVLNPPSAANCKAIMVDGNCLFRTFSHIICGSEDQHMAVRLAFLDHMASERVAPLLLRGHLHGYASIAEYTTAKKMDRDGFWGTEVEMLALAHMLHSTVYSYVCQPGTWNQYSPTNVEHTAMYFQSPCTSDIVLTILMWSALFETPSDLTLAGLLPICLVCGTSHYACRLDPQWTHTLL